MRTWQQLAGPALNLHGITISSDAFWRRKLFQFCLCPLALALFYLFLCTSLSSCFFLPLNFKLIGTSSRCFSSMLLSVPLIVMGCDSTCSRNNPWCWLTLSCPLLSACEWSSVRVRPPCWPRCGSRRGSLRCWAELWRRSGGRVPAPCPAPSPTCR